VCLLQRRKKRTKRLQKARISNPKLEVLERKPKLLTNFCSKTANSDPRLKHSHSQTCLTPHSFEVKKGNAEFVPLLAWLWWLFQTYDATATLDDVHKEMLLCTNEEFREVTGQLGDFHFIKQTLDMQECTSPYKPKSSRVTRDSFLRHVDDVKSAKLKVRLKPQKNQCAYGVRGPLFFLV